MRPYLISLLVGALAPLALTQAPTAIADRTEVARIRRHFDSVLVELRSRDVSSLAPTARAHRASLVATLEAYRDRGRFPQNYDFPGRAVPYFVDRQTGILCAVAHLVESTGRRDIVDRVASSNNNVWVAELATDTTFTSWLDRHGLTLEEAARIQIPYEPTTSRTPFVASAATALASVGTTIWNTTTNRHAEVPLVSALGILTGAASASLAIRGANQSDIPGAMSVVSFGAGLASILASTTSLLTRQRLAAARRDAERKAREERERIRRRCYSHVLLRSSEARGSGSHVSF